MPHISRRNMGFAGCLPRSPPPFPICRRQRRQDCLGSVMPYDFHAVMTSRPRWPYHLPLLRKPMIPLWSCRRGEDIPFNNTFYPLSRLPFGPLSHPLLFTTLPTERKYFLTRRRTKSLVGLALECLLFVTIFDIWSSSLHRRRTNTRVFAGEILLIRLGLISRLTFIGDQTGGRVVNGVLGPLVCILLFLSFFFLLLSLSSSLWVSSSVFILARPLSSGVSHVLQVSVGRSMGRVSLWR